MAAQELRVVVGVDGSADARAAAEWAAREAVAHGAPLVLVHAWSLPAVSGAVGGGAAVAFPVEEVEGSAQQVLADEAAHLARIAPGVEIETRLAYGSPIEVLLELAVEPNLVVVGSRGVGRVAGLLLGSVSQSIVTRAECPVLVVPPADGKQS